jgi:hypothetical protein
LVPHPTVPWLGGTLKGKELAGGPIENNMLRFRRLFSSKFSEQIRGEVIVFSASCLLSQAKETEGWPIGRPEEAHGVQSEHTGVQRTS